MGVIPNKEVLPEYLFAYFNKLDLATLSNGSSVPQINNGDIAPLKIPLPDIDTQKKISILLDKAQELIDKRKEQIETLDELVKSRFIEMFGDPVSNPKNFDMKKIKDISTHLKRGISPKYVDESTIKVMNQKCIYWRELRRENCKYYDEALRSKVENIFLKSDDILINSTGTGTLGRCVKFSETEGSKYIADSHVTVLRSIENTLNPDFFATLFEFANVQDTIYRKCVNGSTNQIELSVSKLGEYLIIIPPVKLQNQFADFSNQVDKLKFDMENSLKELEYNFDSLMQKAFKGELFN